MAALELEISPVPSVAVGREGWVLVVDVDEGPASCRARVLPAANDGWTGAAAAVSTRPRAVLVEAHARGGDPRATVERLRRDGVLRNVPAFVAADAATLEAIGDLDVDDILVHPFTADELNLRIARAERRRQDGAAPSHGDLVIDLAAQVARVRGKVVPLTRREFALLAFFVAHPGRVFERDELLARVWGTPDRNRVRTVDIHVRRLRAKVGPDEFPLETVRGVGYRFQPGGPDAAWASALKPVLAAV
jgi:DNA-binding response OmpR family regulator